MIIEILKATTTLMNRGTGSRVNLELLKNDISSFVLNRLITFDDMRREREETIYLVTVWIEIRDECRTVAVARLWKVNTVKVIVNHFR